MCLFVYVREMVRISISFSLFLATDFTIKLMPALICCITDDYKVGFFSASLKVHIVSEIYCLFGESTYFIKKYIKQL